MVDFSTLRMPTPAEEAEREARHRDAENDRRDAASKKAVTITLVGEPEFRAGRAGESFMILRGTEAGRTTPLAAVYEVPVHIENDRARFDDMARRLGGGDQVTLAGQWSKRGWNDRSGVRHEAWEFKTQHFARGDLPLERVLEVSREAPGGEHRPAMGRGMAAAMAAGMAGRNV